MQPKLINKYYSDSLGQIIFNVVVLTSIGVLFLFPKNVVTTLIGLFILISVLALIFKSTTALFYFGEIVVCKRFWKAKSYTIKINEITKITIKTFNTRFGNHLTLIILSNDLKRSIIINPKEVDRLVTTLKKSGYEREISITE